MAKIELPKASKSQPTKLPPAATPPLDLTGHMPLPVGRPVRIKSPSPGERQVLEAAGWKDGDPVPENLGEIIEEANRQATDIDSMPPPGDLNTPVLKMPLEQRIEDLPTERQAAYADIIKQALAQSKQEGDRQDEITSSLLPAAGQGINEAIRMASTMPQLIDDRVPKKTEQATAKPTEPTVEQTEEVKSRRCNHCGRPVDMPDDAEATDSDKLIFLQSILGLKPFEKNYSIMNNQLIVGVRGMRVDEMDMCLRQCYLHYRNGIATTVEDQADWLARYRCCVQLTRLHGLLDLALPVSIDAWDLPTNIKDEVDKAGNTKLHGIWLWLKQNVLLSDTLYRLIVNKVGQFNTLVLKLEANQDTPDFWQVTG